jgi:hypothetical protein
VRVAGQTLPCICAYKHIIDAETKWNPIRNQQVLTNLNPGYRLNPKPGPRLTLATEPLLNLSSDSPLIPTSPATLSLVLVNGHLKTMPLSQKI